MKNLIKLTAIILLTVFSFSCIEDSEEQTSIENNLLELFEKSSLDKNVLIINGFSNDNIEFKVNDGWETAWTENDNISKRDLSLSDAPGDELCRGDGLSFARCVKKAVDSGKCVKVYAEGGKYVAEEISC